MRNMVLLKLASGKDLFIIFMCKMILLRTAPSKKNLVLLSYLSQMRKRQACTLHITIEFKLLKKTFSRKLIQQF